MILPAAAEKRLLEKGEDGLPQHNVAAVKRQQRRSKRVLTHLKLFTVALTCLLIYTATKRPPHKPFDAQRVRPRLSLEEREQIFLYVLPSCMRSPCRLPPQLRPQQRERS